MGDVQASAFARGARSQRWLRRSKGAFRGATAGGGPDATPALDAAEASDVAGDVPSRDGAWAGCDDESLDTQWDKEHDIDCAQVRAAIDTRRTNQDKLAIETRASGMHSELPRCCVSRSTLVRQFLADLPAPPEAQTAHDVDRAVGMLFCDRLTREIATRHFVAANPACLQLAGQPWQGPWTGDAIGGAR